MANGFTNTTGMQITNINNPNVPSSYTIGLHAVVGTGGIQLLPAGNQYAVIGENRNTTNGIGVFGVSSSPSPNRRQGAVVGFNIGSAPLSYGVVGYSVGVSGAGVVGFTLNGSVGLLGYAEQGSTGPAIKASADNASSQIGLELENSAFKVSGARRSVFQHEAIVGNVAANYTIIPNSSFANAASDLLIVTPFWDNVYVNSPIGVFFNGSSWAIFRQDNQPMPVGAKFNVLVVKQ
jgi:hypothetical protein